MASRKDEMTMALTNGKGWGLSTAPQTESIMPIEIRRDGGTQARVGLNEDTVALYCQEYNDGVTLPPIDLYFDGSSYWLWDGFHRVEAWLRSQHRSGAIPCVIRQGSRRDAVLAACGANNAHGLRRTRDDVQRAIETLLRDPEWVQWSDRAIARACNCHNETVAAARARLAVTDGIRQSETRIGADGRTTRPPLGQRTGSSSNGSGKAKDDPASPPTAEALADRAQRIGVTLVCYTNGEYTLDDGRNVHRAPDAEGAALILDGLAGGLTDRVKALRSRIEALNGFLDPNPDDRGKYLIITPPFVPKQELRVTIAELARIVDEWEEETVITPLTPAAADTTVTPIPIADEYTPPIDDRAADYRDRLRYAYQDDDDQAEGIAALALGCHLLGLRCELLSEVLTDEAYGMLVEAMG